MEGDDSKNTLAIRLIPDHVNWKVDLAVYSFYLTHMVTMTRSFELLENREKIEKILGFKQTG